MKKNLTILIILIGTIAFSQEKLLKKDVVEQEKTFFDTGHPRAIYTKKNGKYHGKFVTYKRTGVKSTEGEYKEGNKTGLWKTYTGNEGTIMYEVNYKNDVENGLKKAYNHEGKLKYEGNNVKGEKDGLWKWYNTEGKIEEEIKYKLGKIISETYKRYHRNGVLKELENYTDSKRDGEQIRYSKAKVIINKRTYKKGELLK